MLRLTSGGLLLIDSGKISKRHRHITGFGCIPHGLMMAGRNGAALFPTLNGGDVFVAQSAREFRHGAELGNNAIGLRDALVLRHAYFMARNA